jgi:uncharacterized protein (TIGR01655 family)
MANETAGKKGIKIGIIVIAAVVVIAVALWFKSYYDSRYSPTDYYAQVPISYNVTPQTIYDDSGEAVGPGVEYDLTAYDESGNAKGVTFTAYVDTDAPPAAGTYLHIMASKQIVNNWLEVTEASIPDKALAAINKV